jgi:hypothetical protein
MQPPAAKRHWERATPAVLAGLAGLLLFWGLADKYLWQDEAATAVLAARMLKFGRPLAYDGLNLVTIDYFATEDTDTIGQRTHDPKAAVDYYIRRGDLKPDTAWKWQPWGQFVVAAIGLQLLGHTTLAARLPFALAGLATVLLWYRLVRRYTGSWSMATVAALLLLGNAYWVLHVRQCRYYSLSSLLLVLTLMTYLRWQRGERWGAGAFLLAGWCWFQVDYGTVWPVFGVLFLDSLAARRCNIRRTAAVGLALAAAMAPFLYYYQLWGRRVTPVRGQLEIFRINLFNTNEYVAPVLLVLAAAVLAAWRWKRLAACERHLVAIACAILLLLLLWVPAVAPEAFLRYVIMAEPLGSLLGAWVLVRACGPRAARFAWLGALVLGLTPWVSLPGRALVPEFDRYEARSLWRSELPILTAEIFGHRPDPNRLTVEWLRRNAAPADEILINYEDLPLMFYLPNPIRGGIPAFRAEDDAKTPPRFAVMRHSVDFLYKEVFDREMRRYQWTAAPRKIPDIIWGNNPDPMMWEQYPTEMTYLYLARRVEGEDP